MGAENDKFSPFPFFGHFDAFCNLDYENVFDFQWLLLISLRFIFMRLQPNFVFSFLPLFIFFFLKLTRLMFWLLFGLKLRLLDFLGKLVLPVEVAPVSFRRHAPL